MPNYKMKPTLNGEGGSTVVANPELVGDEPNLEGLEVEGVKYKVPQGGGLHYAYASFDDANGYSHQITFQCEDTTIETFEDLADYLVSKGFDGDNRDINAFLPVVDYNSFGNMDHRIISGIRGVVTVSSSSTSYEIQVLFIFNNEGLNNQTDYVSKNSFTLTHLE